MKKRIFAFSLVFMLCFVNVHEVYADAGSLVIGGSAIAGVSAGVIAGPAVVAVFCAMMAFGMNVELTKASQNAGMTKTEFLKSKIQQYCNEAQISANTFNNYILDQANVFQNGAISITDKAGNLIEKFCNWLFASESVSSPTTGIVSSVNLLGLTCPVIQPGETFTTSVYYGSNVISIYNEGTKPLALICTKTYAYDKYWIDINAITKDISTFDNFRITTNDVLTNSEIVRTSYSMEVNGVYRCQLSGLELEHISSLNLPLYDEYIGTSGADSFTHIANLIDDIDFNVITADNTITGNMDDYDISKHVLNPSDGETIVINPNINIPVPVDKDVTIDVNEYIDIIQDLIDGVTDDIITAIDDSTDVPITIEFDPTQDWDPTIEKEDDTELPPDDEKTPVVDDDVIPSDFDVDPLKFDLKGFFPFCLPFDVADMIGMLQADPVAPSYTVDWDLPFIEQNLTFTVDLEPYDDVAETCRKMEILLFCVGLAVVTRSIFIRS